MGKLVAIIVVGLLRSGISVGQYPIGEAPVENIAARSIEQPLLQAITPGEDTVVLTDSLTRPLLALKTNLLFDVALMPNLEVELSLTDRWSIVGEYMFPWWSSKDNSRALQIISGSLEGRYWLGNRIHRTRLTGHFVGLYAGGGKYDIENRGKGYQGEFYIASGLSYGYTMPLNRSLNLEFSLGIGYLVTQYHHYKGENNNEILVWQKDGRYTWVGPTKTKVSLVWVLRRKAKRGGGV